MASRERKTAPAKPSETDKISAELQKALDAAEPKDAEQPKPVKKGNGKNGEKKEAAQKKEAEKKPPLALATAEGKVADGETVTVGVMRLATKADGDTIRKKVEIPKEWEIVQPASRARMAHVRAVGATETLCTLSTNWVHGEEVLPRDSYISCGPCRVRMIAIRKTTEKQQEAALERQRKAREKAKADAKKKADEAKAEAKKAEEAKPKEEPKPQAKPDPKPQSRRQRQKSRKTGTSNAAK